MRSSSDEPCIGCHFLRLCRAQRLACRAFAQFVRAEPQGPILAPTAKCYASIYTTVDEPIIEGRGRPKGCKNRVKRPTLRLALDCSAPL
jgi:hypothetical protein